MWVAKSPCQATCIASAVRPGARGPMPAMDPYCSWVIITGQTQSARLHVAASVGMHGSGNV